MITTKRLRTDSLAKEIIIHGIWKIVFNINFSTIFSLLLQRLDTLTLFTHIQYFSLNP